MAFGINKTMGIIASESFVLLRDALLSSTDVLRSTEQVQCSTAKANSVQLLTLCVWLVGVLTP